MIKETEQHLRTLLSMIPSVWLEMQRKIKWRWTPQTPFLVSPQKIMYDAVDLELLYLVMTHVSVIE